MFPILVEKSKPKNLSIKLFLFLIASCMKYGHSCWGAHGKRSNIPAREIKPDGADTWQIFKMPDRVSSKILTRSHAIS